MTPDRLATSRVTTWSASPAAPSGCTATRSRRRGLSDDEIAVATTLARMYQWLDGGPAICSLAHGAQDHYLTLLMHQAAESGQPVRVRGHVWAS